MGSARSKRLQKATPVQQAAPKGMQFSHEALAYMSARPVQGQLAQPYVLPRPAPGVVPKATSLAMDSINGLYAYASENAVYAEGLQFMGYPYLAELTQRPEYRRPAEIFAKEMTRRWIEFQATGEEDKTDRIKQIKAEFIRLNVRGLFREAIEQDGFFGRAQIYIDVGIDPDDVAELKMELKQTKEKIGRKPIRCLTLIEPIWTYPNNYNATDPLHLAFFKPQSWFVMGKEIHASRFLTFVSRKVPDLLKPAYMFGGLSLSQMMKPYVDNWIRTRQSVSDLIHAFTVWVLKTDMSGITNGGGAEDLLRRLQGFNRTRDNHGLNVINKDTEDFTNVSASLAGLDKLQAQAQEQMAAPSGIPLVKLLGITPAGLNASSDGEIRVFEDWCGSQQEYYTQHLTTLLNIVQLTLFGEIDPGITFRWLPLHTLNEAELAKTRKAEADTDCKLIEHGVLTAQEVRKRLAEDEGAPYAALDLREDAMRSMD